MRLFSCKRNYVAFVFFAMATFPSAGISEVSLNTSSDLRGALVVLGEIYKPNTSGSSESGTPSSGSSTSESRTQQNFQVLPSIGLGYRTLLFRNDDFRFGLYGAFNYVDLRANYPSGFRISSSGRNINFTEPASFDLQSFDVGFGPYVQWRFSENLYVAASFMWVHQRLKLSSRLGNWNLEDRLDRSFFEGNASVEYNFLSGHFRDTWRPSVYVNFAGRPGENNVSVGLKLTFN